MTAQPPSIEPSRRTSLGPLINTSIMLQWHDIVLTYAFDSDRLVLEIMCCSVNAMTIAWTARFVHQMWSAWWQVACGKQLL